MKDSVHGDGGRLQQMIENLLRNAVEHGDDDVNIEVGDLEDGYYVEDDGPGIPEDQREKVMEPGYTTRENGTGFGLPIVKNIAGAHGWNLNITESDEGGARFEVRGVETR
ncbi:MAG: sensor histidine kinase [Halobacteria archaeon]